MNCNTCGGKTRTLILFSSREEGFCDSCGTSEAERAAAPSRKTFSERNGLMSYSQRKEHQPKLLEYTHRANYFLYSNNRWVGPAEGLLLYANKNAGCKNRPEMSKKFQRIPVPKGHSLDNIRLLVITPLPIQIFLQVSGVTKQDIFFTAHVPTTNKVDDTTAFHIPGKLTAEANMTLFVRSVIPEQRCTRYAHVVVKY